MGSLTSTITDRTDAEIGRAHVAGDPRVVHTFEPTAYNKTTSAENTLYWSDVGFTTGIGDTPAHTPMPARFTPVTIQASLVKQGAQEGSHRGLPGLSNFAAPEFNVVRLTNSDVDGTGAGTLDTYADRSLWSFAGRTAFLKVGADDLAYTAFEKIMGGAFTMIGEPFWGAEGDLIFVLAPPLKGFGQPFQQHTYGGFGLSLLFDGSTTYVDYGNEWNIGKHDTSIEWRLSFGSLGSVRRIQQKRQTLSGATDIGYSLWLDASNQLIFGANDGTNNGTINMGAAGAYDDDVKRMFSVTVNWTTLEIEAFVSHYVAGVKTTTSLGTIDITGWTAIYNELDNIGGAGLAGASPTYDGLLDEFRVHRKALTSGEIAARAYQTMTGSEKFVAAVFKFDDRTTPANPAWQNVVIPGLNSIEYKANTHEISYGDFFDVDPSSTDDLTAGIWIKTGDVSAGPYCLGNRTAHAATNAGWAVFVGTSGAVSAVVDDGSTRVIVPTTGTDYGFSTWIFAGIRITSGASRIVEALGMTSRDGPLETASASITALGDLSNANALTVGRVSGGTANNLPGRTGHHFALPQVLTEDELLSVARYMWDLDTITMPQYGMDAIQASVSSFWNQNTGSGLTVFDSFGSIDGTITLASWTTQDATLNGTIAFVSSLDGDAGLGELSNESNVQGLRVPHAWGWVEGMEMVLIDNGDDGASAANPIYQYGDPLQGTTKAVTEVYSGGLVLTLAADYSAADLTNNAVTFIGTQNEVVTANLQGYVDGNGDVITRTGAISAELFTLAGETTQNAASLASVGGLYPYRCGLVTDTDDHLTEEVIDGCLRPMVFATKNIAGEIEWGVYRNLDGATVDFELTTANVKEDGLEIIASFPPASKIEWSYRRNWAPLTSFLGGVQTPEQLRQKKQYRQITFPVADTGTTNLDAQPVSVTSHIHLKHDAMIAAENLSTIFNRPLVQLKAKLSADIYKAEIGDVVKLTYPRFGFSAGKLFLCIGYTYPLDPSLFLWGPFELT